MSPTQRQREILRKLHAGGELLEMVERRRCDLGREVVRVNRTTVEALETAGWIRNERPAEQLGLDEWRITEAGVSAIAQRPRQRKWKGFTGRLV